MLLFFTIDATFIYTLFCPLLSHAGVAAAAAVTAEANREVTALNVFYAIVVNLLTLGGESVALSRF